MEVVVSVTVNCLPFGGGPLGAVKATLGSNELLIEHDGNKVGTLKSMPVQLGGGGYMKRKLIGSLVVDDREAFAGLAKDVIFADKFNIEVSGVIAIELRGTENGCFLKKSMCETIGSFRIDGVKFAQSIQLNGAQGLLPTLHNFRLSDLPSSQIAGRALILIDAKIQNPSSFVLGGLGEVGVDVHTDLDPNAHDDDESNENAMGVQFATVKTDKSFHLPRGESPWFTVKGQISVAEREHDLIETARVLDNFLTGNVTQLLARVRTLELPFFSVAAAGTPLRAPLPGLVRTQNIIQMVYVSLDVPQALLSLTAGINSLTQNAQVEVLNPLDCTIYVTGIVAEVFYDGEHVGDVNLPYLGGNSILVPPLALYRSSAWVEIELNGNPLTLARMLQTMATEPALVDLDARLTVRVGGAEPILKYLQHNVKVGLAIGGPGGEFVISGKGEHLDELAGTVNPSPPPPPLAPPSSPPAKKGWFGRE